MDHDIGESSVDGIEFRILRIVWSTVWVVVCVFVLALWSRSFYYDDRCFLDVFGGGVSLESDIGQVHVEAFGNGGHGASLLPHWGLESSAAETSGQFGNDQVWAFEYVALNSWTIHVPHWFGVFLSAWLAVLPWLLLIAARGIRWIRGRIVVRAGGGSDGK